MVKDGYGDMVAPTSIRFVGDIFSPYTGVAVSIRLWCLVFLLRLGGVVGYEEESETRYLSFSFAVTSCILSGVWVVCLHYFLAILPIA